MNKQDNDIFTVVDKHDRIIGYRSRFDCHHDKSLIHRAIGVAVFNKKGEILLQKRSKNKDRNAGKYTISVSGHVDKGETYLKAAEREMFEEIGIKSPLKRKVKFFLELPYETEIDCIFAANHEGPFYPDTEEVDELKFVNPEDLSKMLDELTEFAKLSLKNLNLL